MELKEEYDVIIAGAGPAGSMAAQVCAEGGLSVLLLEKRQEIGAPKRCAEGIGIKPLKLLGFTGNENFITQKINGAIVVSPDNTEVMVEYGGDRGVILERKLFDKALCYRAAEAGAKIIAKAYVTGIIKENGKISGAKVKIDGETLEIKSKILITT